MEKANTKGSLSSACLRPSTPDLKVPTAYEASFSVVSELLQTSPPSYGCISLELGMVLNACNLSTWEVEEGGSGVQGHSWLIVSLSTP